MKPSPSGKSVVAVSLVASRGFSALARKSGDDRALPAKPIPPAFLLLAVALGVMAPVPRLVPEELFSAEPLSTAGQFTAGIEGPACDRDGNVYAVNFAKQGTIGRVTPDGKGQTWVTLPEGSVGNGIRFDASGAMYVADYPRHNILRVDPVTRKVGVFAHEARMNQPNDLAIAPDGTLFASDPDWGKGDGQVWRIGRDGKVSLAVGKMGTTNGIEVSPEGDTLYVNESVQRIIWAFTITPDGKIVDKRMLRKFEDHGFDGMRCDVFGNLYVTRYGKGTVVKLSPRGEVLRQVDVLGARPSNICFGGIDGRTAYVTEVEHRRLVKFRVDAPGLAWNRWVRTRVSANESKEISADGFPARVHVAEDYETDIEKRWWLRGEGESKKLPAGGSQRVTNHRAMRAAPSRDFDRKMGDRSAMYRAVVFNPVPGPPMGARTRLRFRYRLDGSDVLRVQIYSLSRGYHRYLTLRGVPTGEWRHATVDLTRARRPDGSGGPLAKDERIDDIQLYVAEKATLLVDDIVLYDAAEVAAGVFPRRVIFSGWFDTGKQGTGKEWPGDFVILRHDRKRAPDSPGTWKYARSVAGRETAAPWIRVDLRGARPLGDRTSLFFAYRHDGSPKVRVQLVERREDGVDVVGERRATLPVQSEWATIRLSFDTAPASDRTKPRVANEVRFLLEKGELRIDDLLLYEP